MNRATGRVDTDWGPEIVLLLLGVVPQELEDGPEERDSWTIEFLASINHNSQAGSSQGDSSHEVNRQPKSAYS